MAGEPGKQWTANTPWRQGSVLTADAAATVGIAHPAPGATTVALVISHDCDLACDNLDIEPEVEILAGRLVEKPDGNYSWGKSPRTLHVPIIRAGSEVMVELVATEKRICQKNDLAQHEPDEQYTLSAKSLSVIRSWLSARYNRSAFPDAFFDRVMTSTKFGPRLAKLLEPHGHLISHVYFDLDQGNVVEKKAGDPYELSVFLVYPPGDDPEKSIDAAEMLAVKIEEEAQARFAGGKEIVLRSCIAVSEDDMTIAQARVLMQWRLEHMTHKGDGQPGPVAA